MNKVLKKSVFRWLLVFSLIISPVLVVADTISDAAAQNRTEIVKMPCHQMTLGAKDSEKSNGRSLSSDPCPHCDQHRCFQNKSCQNCLGWGHFTALVSNPMEYAVLPVRRTIGPVGERILDFNSPPLLPPPLRPSIS